MTQPVLPIPEQPYRGLEPFRFIDQDIFVGRENEVGELLNLVINYRGVLLYGASGLGKSSLINAGLVPAALAENIVPVRLRIQPRPGAEFIASGFFESQFENFEAPHSDQAFGVDSINSFIERLGGSPEAGGPRPLLIFDQFEELVTLFEDQARRGAAHEVQTMQTRIVERLVTVLQDPQLRTKLLFVFREDFFAKFNILFERYPDLIDQRLRILPVRTDKLFDIIRAPFVSLPETFKPEISPELAHAIADEVSERDLDGSIDFTALQIACLRLWRSDNAEVLFAQKGIPGLLQDSFSEQLDHLPADVREAAVVLLSYLITSSNTRNIVSEDDLLDRAKDEGINHEELTAALQELRSARLIQREVRHNVYFYQIVSEFLIPFIKQLTTQRQLQKQLELQRKVADAHFQEERRRGKRKTRFVVVLVSVVALLSGLILVATSQRLEALRLSRAAKHAQLQAENERFKAERITNILESLTSNDANARLSAIGAIETLQSENPQLAAHLLGIAIRDKDPRVAARASELLTEPVGVPK